MTTSPCVVRASLLLAAIVGWAACASKTPTAGTSPTSGRRLTIGPPTWSKAAIAPGDQVELTLTVTFASDVVEPDPDAGQQFLAYPTVELTADHPQVEIESGGPSVYGLYPGTSGNARLRVTFGGDLAPGTTIRFRGIPRVEGPRQGVEAQECSFAVTLRK